MSATVSQTKRRAVAAGSTTGSMLGVLAVIATCTGAAATLRSTHGATPEGACDEILRRYADARLRQADPEPTKAAAAAQREAVERRAERSARFGRCEETVGEERARCALAAGNADEIERCLQ
jgi:hypothetical protein